jgi:hypothetical protein
VARGVHERGADPEQQQAADEAEPRVDALGRAQALGGEDETEQQDPGGVVTVTETPTTTASLSAPRRPAGTPP